MLTARPASAGSWSFLIEDDRQRKVAAVELRRMKDEGTVRVGAVPFALEKAGLLAPSYTLRFEGVAVASAVRSGVVRARYRIEVEAGLLGSERPLGIEFEASWTGRAFRAASEGQDLGEVLRRGTFRRMALVDLSGDLPLGVQTFLLALVLIEWRRAARSG